MTELEKSEKMAECITAIKLQILVHGFDLEHGRKAAQDIIKKGNHLDSIMILNPGRSTTLNEVLREQGRALLHLCDFVESFEKLEKLGKKIGQEKEAFDRIENLFK